jgi:flavin reductase (DIM6/NTAB) family NADH-FMN oxidoreductase RutF
MRFINSEDIRSFEQRYRATFINSIGGFKSLCLIGTINSKGITNLAVFNSYFHLGANPPLFGLIVRPDSVDRHTLQNIRQSKFFTVNHVNEKIYQQAHQTSARYTSQQSEFTETGLTEEFLNDFPAPYVKESNIKIGARCIREMNIEENGTLLLINGIENIALPENLIAQDGFVAIEKAGSITCSGLDSYHRTEQISRLAYAKPGKPIEKISS